MRGITSGLGYKTSEVNCRINGSPTGQNAGTQLADGDILEIEVVATPMGLPRGSNGED